MAEPRWKSPYPAEITEVRLTAMPRGAVLSIASRDSTLALHLVDPHPLTELCKAFESCEVRVYSKNDEEQGQLEFGQYRVELWDEDACLGEVRCDDYEVREGG